jgi:TetR/AcrR family transcriptional regulator
VGAKATKARAAAASPPPQPTREAILDAAERMFSAKGVDGVAVRDLARELGLTASSLYNHFPGKQALYEAVLERGLRPIVDLVAASWQETVEVETVSHTVTRLVAHLAGHPHLGRLLQRALIEDSDSVHALLARWLSALYREGVAIVGQTARAADWEPVEVPHLAIGLFGLVFAHFVNGPTAQRYGSFDDDAFAPATLETQRRFLEKAIIRLLGAQPGAGTHH